MGTETPKEVPDKFTIEDFELSFIEVSCNYVFNKKIDDKIRLIVLLIGGF